MFIQCWKQCGPPQGEALQDPFYARMIVRSSEHTDTHCQNMYGACKRQVQDLWYCMKCCINASFKQAPATSTKELPWCLFCVGKKPCSMSAEAVESGDACKPCRCLTVPSCRCDDPCTCKPCACALQLGAYWMQGQRSTEVVSLKHNVLEQACVNAPFSRLYLAVYSMTAPSIFVSKLASGDGTHQSKIRATCVLVLSAVHTVNNQGSNKQSGYKQTTRLHVFSKQSLQSCLGSYLCICKHLN